MKLMQMRPVFFAALQCHGDVRMNLTLSDFSDARLTEDTGVFTSVHGKVSVMDDPMARWWQGVICILEDQPNARAYFTMRHSEVHEARCIFGCFRDSSGTPSVAVFQMQKMYCYADFDGDDMEFSANATISGNEFDATICSWDGYKCASTSTMLTTLRFSGTDYLNPKIPIALDGLPAAPIPEAESYAGVQADGNVVALFGKQFTKITPNITLSYGTSQRLVTMNFGSSLSSRVPFSLWYGKKDEYPASGYCVGVVEVYLHYFEHWVTAVPKVSFYEMCNLQCVARRVNASVPVVGNTMDVSRPPAIGWDLNVFDLDAQPTDGFRYFVVNDATGFNTSCPMPDNPEPKSRDWEVLLWWRSFLSSAVLNVMVVGFLMLSRLRAFLRKRSSTSSFVDMASSDGNSRSSVLLAADGCLVNLTPLREVVRPLAVVIANQKYQFYDELFHAYADGERAQSLFQSIGYDEVLLIQDATFEDIIQLPLKIARSLSGKNNALVPIFYAGHATEVAAAGQIMFAPVDAQPADPTTHVSRARLCCDLQDICTQRVKKAFDIQPANAATFIVIADCCRVKPADPCCFAAHLATCSFSEAGNLAAANTKRPRFLFAFACDPGRAAHETDSSQSGYFTRVFVEEARFPRPVLNLFAAVGSRLERETRGKQRAWTDTQTFRMDHSLGSEGMCISLAASSAEQPMPLGESARSRGIDDDSNGEEWETQIWPAT